MPKYRYAFYDLDGTIGDTCEGIFNCAANAMRKMGVEFDDSYDSMRRLIGPPLVYAFENYFGLDKVGTEEATRLYRERYSVKGLYEMRLYDGLEESLQKLSKSGVTMAVVSAKPEEFVKRIVAHFGLDKYFSLCVGPDMTEGSTSKTHLIKRALEYFDITDVNDVVMIGDRKYDLDSAEELDIDGIGVAYGYGDTEELEACNPVFIANTPQEICGYILGD